MELGALSSANLFFTRMLCGVGCDVRERSLVSCPEGVVGGCPEGTSDGRVDDNLVCVRSEIFQVNLSPVFSATPTQYPFFSLDAEGKA